MCGRKFGLSDVRSFFGLSNAHGAEYILEPIEKVTIFF